MVLLIIIILLRVYNYTIALGRAVSSKLLVHNTINKRICVAEDDVIMTLAGRFVKSYVQTNRWSFVNKIVNKDFKYF